MGIYDRDYARPDDRGRIRPGPGVRVRLAGLTAVHWLIIINCLVFAADHLMGARRVMWKVHMGTTVAANTPQDVFDRARPNPDVILRDQDSPGGVASLPFHPIIDPATGAMVGKWYLQYMTPLAAIGHFSTYKGFIGLEVWRFVTFQFLHANLSHLLFNMIGLWFFGPIVEDFLGSRKRFLAYYLICGIFGAILYLILNLIGFLLPGVRLPGVLIDSIYTPLIGASAGVFGVLMACARVAGNATMLVMFVLPLKVRTGAYIMFLAALINLLAGGSNAGGDAAHVGGAIAGFFFIRRPHLLHEFFDVLKRSAPARTARQPSPKDEQRLDEILAKVNEHGIHSLTPAEKKFLNKQTDEKRGRG